MVKVESVEIIDSDEDVWVYDIEVPEDESFQACGVVLHNSLLCSSHDQAVYDLNKPHPKPPLHWNCRSVLAPFFGGKIAGNRPYVKAFKPVRRIRQDDRPEGMIGQVRASTSMSEFLKRPDNAAFAREYFGDTRYRLFKEGKLDIRQMVRADGTRYSIAELRQRYAKDFREVFG